MFCRNCGNQLPEGSKFCVICGSPVIREETVMPQAQVSNSWQTDAAPDAPEQKVSPAKKKPVLAIVLGVFAVLLAAFAAFLIWKSSGKTVYLLTEMKTEAKAGDNVYTNITTYEYDDMGNPIAYGQKTVSQYSTGFSIEYGYDKNGRLESAEIEFDGGRGVAEYSYNKDGTMKAIVVESSDEEIEMEVECNAEGKIEELVVRDENGEVIIKSVYAYHKDGWLEEVVQRMDDQRICTVYDENGNRTEYEMYLGDTLYLHQEFEHDEYGNTTRQYTESGGYQSEMTIDYTYDKKGSVTGFEMKQDNVKMKAKLKEESDQEKLFKLSGSEIIGDSYIRLKYDEGGNLREVKLVVDGEEQQRITYKYDELKVSGNYTKPNWNEAQYLLWSLG